MQDPKVLVALDYQHEADAFAFIEQISPAQCRLKVGKEM
ncbi:orotidine-5'-phosphate decarboxylase, partial [Aeromonas sp. CPF2-S1]|nr:orotidine-5'-phosphate decarboxylase [Aeromonas sp. CPF2-S1]